MSKQNIDPPVHVISAADAIRWLDTFEPGEDGLAAKSADLVRMLLAHTETPFSRYQFLPGHITCTSLVLHPQRDRVLLVHHRRLDKWLLPGGHVEPEDESLEAAAAREAVEETGVVLDRTSATKLVSVDVHGIPGRKSEPYHLHHDLVFAFTAVAERLEGSDEVRDVAWCGLDEFDRYQLKDSIRLAIPRALRGDMNAAR